MSIFQKVCSCCNPKIPDDELTELTRVSSLSEASHACDDGDIVINPLVSNHIQHRHMHDTGMKPCVLCCINSPYNGSYII